MISSQFLLKQRKEESALTPPSPLSHSYTVPKSCPSHMLQTSRISSLSLPITPPDSKELPPIPLDVCYSPLITLPSSYPLCTSPHIFINVNLSVFVFLKHKPDHVSLLYEALFWLPVAHRMETHLLRRPHPLSGLIGPLSLLPAACCLLPGPSFRSSDKLSPPHPRTRYSLHREHTYHQPPPPLSNLIHLA